MELPRDTIPSLRPPHPEVEAEQLHPVRLGRQRDVNALLQPSPHGLVNVPRKVGRCMHNDTCNMLGLM